MNRRPVVEALDDMVLLLQDFLPIPFPMVEVNCVPRSGSGRMTYQASSAVSYHKCELSRAASYRKCELSRYSLERDRTGLIFSLSVFYSLSVGFDLISQFQIEKAASRRTIQRVVGSTALQVAYKLGSNVDFRIPTR